VLDKIGFTPLALHRAILKHTPVAIINNILYVVCIIRVIVVYNLNVYSNPEVALCCFGAEREKGGEAIPKEGSVNVVGLRNT
jgi:hypothetical protein